MASLVLGINDLRKVLNKYSKYQMNWYDIGLQLEIEKHVLDTIKSDYQNKIGDCFREMLAHWLQNDKSATTFRLRKAIEDIECSTNSLTLSLNKWYKDLGHHWAEIILLSILGVILFMYYQDSNSPIKSAEEILKNEYRAHKVIKFNLPISGNSDLEYLGVVMKDTDGREFGHSELVQNYSGKTGRLIVTGLPGSGKTTLLRHLAKKWADGRALKSCRILFLISLGSLEGEVNALGDLLSKSGFGDLMNLKDISEKIYATDGAGACFLFDAYDELKWNHRYKFIDVIMEGSKINSSFCLLTSRPFSSERFKKQMQFEILGYNVDNLPNYLHKLSDNATLVSAIQHSWDNNPKVKEMCTLPLHMVMMLYIYSYESCSVSIRTTTQLYIAFMNVTIKYYEGHHHEWNTESLWQCILAEGLHGDDLCSAFNILHQVAYDMVFKDRDFFHDIKGTKGYINQLSFVGVTSVHGSKSQVKFTFSHPTFMEFFAALHLTTLPLNQQLAFITAYELQGKESYLKRLYIMAQQDYSLSRVMYVEFYLGLVGDKFNYNISGATPFLKQLFLKSSIENGVCFVYKWVEEVIGWTTQQYRNAIDTVFKVNYSMCAYHSFLSPLSEGPSKYYSDYLLLPWDTDKLALGIIITFREDSMIVVTFVDYVYLTRQDQLHLFLCIQGLRDNTDSNCHGLRLPSIATLYISYFPYADSLYQMKRALPNLEYIDIRLSNRDWNQFNNVIESLSKALKRHETTLALLNLRIEIHLLVFIDRCSVEGTRMPPYFDEINHVSLRHITLTGVCHDNNFTKHLCTSVLKYSIFVEDDAHAQSLVTCIQQAQNLKTLSLAYYEGAVDKTEHYEIFKNLPQTLQTLNVCGVEQSVNTYCDEYCKVSSTLDIKLIVDALIERKNLHTLTLSISSVEDMKTLTQLTFLVHLHIIWDDSYESKSMDKSTALLIARNLQHFPQLESFTLTASCYHMNDYDKQEILSIIFDTSPAREIQICSTQLDIYTLPQFKEIIYKHTVGIQPHITMAARTYHKFDVIDGPKIYDYDEYDLQDYVVWDDQNN